MRWIFSLVSSSSSYWSAWMGSDLSLLTNGGWAPDANIWRETTFAGFVKYSLYRRPSWLNIVSWEWFWALPLVVSESDYVLHSKQMKSSVCQFQPNVGWVTACCCQTQYCLWIDKYYFSTDTSSSSTVLVYPCYKYCLGNTSCPVTASIAALLVY